jgi:hypothetical protein
MTILIDRYISDIEIETCAMKLLQRYGRQQEPILAPPIPIERILDYSVDIPVIWDAIPNDEGVSVLAKLKVNKKPQPEIAIIVNEDKQLFFEQHEGLEQFSLAHELGHYMLHINHANLRTLLLPGATERHIVLCRADSSQQRDRKEWQADRFAAYLLMPQDLFGSNFFYVACSVDISTQFTWLVIFITVILMERWNINMKWCNQPCLVFSISIGQSLTLIFGFL